MRMTSLLNVINFSVPKYTLKQTHQTRKPSTTNGNQKRPLLKKVQFFLSEKVCAEKGALISQNAFFKAKAFMKVKGYFDHTKCFEETSQRAEKDRKYFPQLFQQNSHPHNGIKKPHKTTKKKQKILAYFLYFASSGLRKSGQIRANGEKN